MSTPERPSLDVAVVGGGILGLAIARELTLRRPGLAITVFEKDDELGGHQTGHNSGVVHAGIYYKPGSLKATLCTRGRLLLREFCIERGLPYDECGKLVVAVGPDEMARFDELERTAGANGVPGLRRVDGAGIREIEPHAAGIAALHSPATAITDYVAVAKAMAVDVEAAGGVVRCGTTVTAIERGPFTATMTTADGPVEARQVIVCAGLQSDRVSAPVDGEAGPRIVPFRGEYMVIDEAKRDLVRGLIYPVPDPRYPFLGVHFTRRVDGVVDIGPNAVLALAREGYGRTDVDLRDVGDLISWPGFWRMASRHWRTGVKEVWGSLSTSAYLAGAARYVPEIGPDDVTRGPSGIRAQAVDRDGGLVDDFRINEHDNVVTIRNAPSPAATSSLAIAEYVLDQVGSAA